MSDIKSRLDAHYAKACAHFGEDNILGVFLYGSQNYGLATESSDVDTKCILIPDLKHLAVNPYKTTHLDVDGEVCECMTIMHMVANWKKQNINFVEIMFTPYCKLNARYAETWVRCLDSQLREDIGRYDLRGALLSMAHQAIHTIKQDPTDGKKVMNANRIYHSLIHLLNGNLGYWDCIHYDDEDRESFLSIRAGHFGENLPDLLLRYLQRLIDSADTREYIDPADKEEVDALLEILILELIADRIEN